MLNISPNAGWHLLSFLLITQDKIITKRILKLYCILLGPIKISYLFVLKRRVEYNSHFSTNVNLSQACKFSAVGLFTCSTDKLFYWQHNCMGFAKRYLYPKQSVTKGKASWRSLFENEQKHNFFCKEGKKERKIKCFISSPSNLLKIEVIMGKLKYLK